jgi:hypothetical protein
VRKEGIKKAIRYNEVLFLQTKIEEEEIKDGRGGLLTRS